VSVQAATQDSAPLFLMAALPALSVLNVEQIGAMPADELVARRVMELDAADALDAVRTAIEAHDWTLAQRLVETAQSRFAGHEWAAAILSTMQRLIAQRDEQLASKEARYARHSIHGRLASLNEASFSDIDEALVPAFLRRKTEQGKGQRDA
jgi:Ca-activated chloride channel family protein